MATTHPFTCNTCQVAFRGSDLQRTHMQSDWHRYNLKRRVASLPPLTSEIFAEKVLANKASAAATAARASFQRQCEACDKTYFSEGAYVNHLGSQKHKLAVAKAAKRGTHGADTESMTDSTFSLGDPVELASTQDGETEGSDDELDNVVASMAQTQLNGAAKVETENAEDEDDEDEDYEHTADPSQCLFCNYVSDSMDNNTNHMNRQHGFFVPEREYLVDMPGLITHLSETIQVLNQCLFCHKAAHTPSGAQTHMRDRGHCMMAYSTEEEQLDVGDFYDFRATYSDEESESEEEGAHGISLGAKRAVKTVIQNEDGEDEVMSDDDEEWESGSEASSVPTDEITSVPVERRAPKVDRNRIRQHKSSDGYHSHAHQTAYHDDYELHLPSGRTAGHRSLRQYYKQNLRNFQTDDEKREQKLLQQGAERSGSQERERGRQVASRANGGLGMIGVSEAKKREIAVTEKRQEKRAQRVEARYQWGNNKRANHQKHFRDHLLQ
ncbi:hypothetical protein AMS68_007336 [Peltaster fructicola]|uniref:C2H2-type domain-containing protein n=1 Tax=Peltaster fructicola TaxID=286661 RepID=A0A6H0Y4Q1_9PEZI|nr:hypothetical protein AMS68_007336 [Peltaster fructicola]